MGLRLSLFIAEELEQVAYKSPFQLKPFYDLICALPFFLAGPAAADRKGLESMETSVFTKLCSAEVSGG